LNILEERIKEKFPDEDILILNYTLMKSPATVKCNVCNTEYTLARAENFIRKEKRCICKKCVNNHSGGRLDLSDFQKKIDKRYPKEHLRALNYTLKNKPCDIQCLTCGNTYHFMNAESAYASGKQRLCSYCFPNKREQMLKSVNRFKEFIQNSKNFVLLDDLDSMRIQARTLVACQCKKCGAVNKKTIYDYLRGKGCSCEGNNVLLTEEQYQIELGEEYTLLSEYKGWNHSVKIRHNLCGFCYDVNARHYTCPKCSGSKGEKAIAFYLEQQDIPYYREKIEEIENHKLRFDFYLPKYDVYIEFQGEQHFKSVPYFGGDSTLQKQQRYDEYKKQWCKKNNHNLLLINFNENIQDKLENYLLKFNDYPGREYTQGSGSGNGPI